MTTLSPKATLRALTEQFDHLLTDTSARELTLDMLGFSDGVNQLNSKRTTLTPQTTLGQLIDLSSNDITLRACFVLETEAGQNLLIELGTMVAALLLYYQSDRVVKKHGSEMAENFGLILTLRIRLDKLTSELMGSF